jgi:hypothetical protein
MNDKQLKEIHIDIIEDGYGAKMHRSYYYQGVRLKTHDGGDLTHAQISKMGIGRVVSLVFEAGKRKRAIEIASLLHDGFQIKQGEGICYDEE